MVQSEEEVLKAAQAILEQKQYQKLRNYIYSHHALCQTDPIKLQLLRLWEESLYQEFIAARSHGPNGEAREVVLSSSMRYKLRKKNPCPVELEHELRVKNARLPKNVHDGLNAWLKKHTENPYPNKVEKEGLAKKLNITPQQVNRWFIQRRKMLRIRGRLYLGRQYEHAILKGEPLEGHEGQDDFDHDDYDDDMDDGFDMEDDEERADAHEAERHSLLEKILTGSAQAPHPQQQQQQQQQPAQMARFSGGYVQEIDQRSNEIMLTPPPSVSGESLARSTPPATDIYGRPMNLAMAVFDHNEAPLDLTKDHYTNNGACRITVVNTPKSSPVILEPVTPPWKSAAESSGASSMRSSPVFPTQHHLPESDYYQQQQQQDTLDYDEQMAVTALLSLSRASARC